MHFSRQYLTSLPFAPGTFSLRPARLILRLERILHSSLPRPPHPFAKQISVLRFFLFSCARHFLFAQQLSPLQIILGLVRLTLAPRDHFSSHSSYLRWNHIEYLRANQHVLNSRFATSELLWADSAIVRRRLRVGEHQIIGCPDAEFTLGLRNQFAVWWRLGLLSTHA